MLLLSDTVFENAIKSARLSEGTKTSYLKQLTMVKALFEASPYKTIYQVLIHPQEAKRWIESKVRNESLSLNSARSLVICLLSLFKHTESSGNWTQTEELRTLHTEWSEIVHEYNAKTLGESEKNEFSERERDAYVDFDEWIDMEKKLQQTEPGSLRHLLVAFHTLITPVRGGDLAVVSIIPPTSPLATKSTENVLVWAGADKPATLLIRDHKTRVKYPVLKRELSLPLRRAIAQSLKEQPRKYLFVDSSGDRWIRNSFMTWKANTLRDLFGKSVTTNLARHAFVNATHSTTDSIATERKRAEQMGHSLEMHQRYRKIDKK